MGRHARVADARVDWARPAAVTLVWLAGLGAGFFALLSAATKYTGCGSRSTGLACRGSGSLLGVLLVVAVIATVTTVTVVTHGRDARRAAVTGVTGLAVLGLCYWLATRLIATA